NHATGRSPASGPETGFHHATVATHHVVRSAGDPGSGAHAAGRSAKVPYRNDPAQWYALLNRLVFFWCDRDRLNRQLGACNGRAQIVLTVDTKQLLARHARHVALTPFNTGNA